MLQYSLLITEGSTDKEILVVMHFTDESNQFKMFDLSIPTVLQPNYIDRGDE
jgi:hypothetical protein